MQITFAPLTHAHFPLLLKWLMTPHVHAWWDKNVTWTPELIAEKYDPYVTGHTTKHGTHKSMHSFIIMVNGIPTGYIQYYNHYDFSRIHEIAGLPDSLAAFDMYIGEESMTRKGIGSTALKLFLATYVDPQYEYTYADPDMKNSAAIRTYEKVGFVIKSDGKRAYMLRKNKAEC